MQLRKTILASVLSAALALSAAACGTAENTQSVRSAAASEHVAETPTPSPEATATASPTAEPTVKSTASPAPESNEVSENAEITAEIEAMAPLLEAHILAQMNGMAFDANDPVYFWQTAAFAVDQLRHDVLQRRDDRQRAGALSRGDGRNCERTIRKRRK